MDKGRFDELWDKADLEYRSQGNNSFTFQHHLFTELNDELNDTPTYKIMEIINEYRLKYGYPYPKPWMLMSSFEVIDLLEQIERVLKGE